MTTTELYRELLLCYSYHPYECVVDREDIQDRMRSSYRVVNDITLDNSKLQLCTRDIIAKSSVNNKGMTSTALLQRLTKNIGEFDYNIQKVTCSSPSSWDTYHIGEIKLVPFFNKEALCFFINRGRSRI